MRLATPWNGTRGTRRSSSSRGRTGRGPLRSRSGSPGETAWFTARADIATEAKERAFKVYLAHGDKIRAAYLAFQLTHSTCS